MAKVLGISCSLRNARFGAGSDALVEEIKTLKDETALNDFLRLQTKIRADDFFKAGRKENRSFDEIYRNLQKLGGTQGLSNSEAALVAGLWGAFQNGGEIMHCGLSAYFSMSGPGKNFDELRKIVLESDALLVSSPVYFGDRSSLAQEFFEFLREDKACRQHIRDKIYAGISVGAKRNGGQETTLIYQLLDATNLNMLAVGNDSATTAQYGGTAFAGDVGALADDEYGINTSIGAGRRIASVSQSLEKIKEQKIKDKVRIAIWVLQDLPDHSGQTILNRFAKEIEKSVSGVEISVFNFTQEEINRCIACDICPTSVGEAEDYRCIINSKNDLFKRRHKDILDNDAILLAAYSPIDRSNINSVYQRFVERTRYLRRDDYAIGDRLIAPIVISEMTSRQNLHIRMLTSFIRHHSVIHHPIIGMEHKGELLNWDSMLEQGKSFARNATRLTVARLMRSNDQITTRKYNPVGYVISAEKRHQDEKMGAIKNIVNLRKKNVADARKKRL